MDEPTYRVVPVPESFEGYENRECGEHRTVGPHRAWCHDCGEWCYPSAKRACRGCELPALRCDLTTYREQFAGAHRRIADLEQDREWIYAEFAQARRDLETARRLPDKDTLIQILKGADTQQFRDIAELESGWAYEDLAEHIRDELAVRSRSAGDDPPIWVGPDLVHEAGLKHVDAETRARVLDAFDAAHQASGETRPPDDQETLTRLIAALHDPRPCVYGAVGCTVHDHIGMDPCPHDTARELLADLSGETRPEEDRHDNVRTETDPARVLGDGDLG